jgi:hypothetical protein
MLALPKRAMSATALNGLGTGREVARPGVFPASDAAGSITGVNLYVIVGSTPLVCASPSDLVCGP